MGKVKQTEELIFRSNHLSKLRLQKLQDCPFTDGKHLLWKSEKFLETGSEKYTEKRRKWNHRNRVSLANTLSTTVYKNQAASKYLTDKNVILALCKQWAITESENLAKKRQRQHQLFSTETWWIYPWYPWLLQMAGHKYWLCRCVLQGR